MMTPPINMKKQSTIPGNLICLSHLRWDFVYQRPQHLLTRFAKQADVYFYEEPVFDGTEESFLEISNRGEQLYVVVPHLQQGLNQAQIDLAMSALFDQFIAEFELDDTIFWYYTPMALPFTEKHSPKAVIYDCMDELSGFKFAHSEIGQFEQKLIARADLMFTGGYSLYQAKKQYHNNIYPFPSSIEKEHFATARFCDEAADQVSIKGPKIGFFGVIDERFDTSLIGEIATAIPNWQLIIIGPVVKIDAETLPKNTNIHYLGQKTYKELPSYLAGWDVAMLPFLLNESTRFISPTKTPEYLAANIPVVSTPIHDVISPYGDEGLVHICNNSNSFINAINEELQSNDKSQWEQKVSLFLEDISWDKTQFAMAELIMQTISDHTEISIAS